MLKFETVVLISHEETYKINRKLNWIDIIKKSIPDDVTCALKDTVSESVVSRPGALALPEELLEIQIWGIS